jgi:hypothetical protein
MRFFVIAFIFMCLVTACENAPFVDAEIEYKKLSDDCDTLNSGISLVSNIMGERYEFQQCLDNDFEGQNFTAERKGDTVVVDFSGAKKKPSKALYQITLDIDASPRYRFMSIEGNTFEVVPAQPK